MSKKPEDLLEDKETDYLRGFLDAATLLNSEFQTISHRSPPPKPFDQLSRRIEELYTAAAEAYDSQVKKRFGINWKPEDFQKEC